MQDEKNQSGSGSPTEAEREAAREQRKAIAIVVARSVFSAWLEEAYAGQALVYEIIYGSRRIVVTGNGYQGHIARALADVLAGLTSGEMEEVSSIACWSQAQMFERLELSDGSFNRYILSALIMSEAMLLFPMEEEERASISPEDFTQLKVEKIGS